MKIIIASCLLMLCTSTVFAAGGVWVNGDLTLAKETADPLRVLYFSNGTSQYAGQPWSYYNLDLYFLGGRVGIGIDRPSSALDVNGTVTATGFSGNGSGLTGIIASVPDGGITTSKILDGAVTNAKITGPISISKIEKYGRVAVVAKSGGDYIDPAVAMSDFASWCGDPSASPCLLKIMPGVYAVSAAVVMQPYIDIEGSGENVTKITSVISSFVKPLTMATVVGANNAELRFLTVENTSNGEYAVAILNTSVSPSLLHVSATASGGEHFSCGVYNAASSPRMSNVVTTVTGGTSNIGVWNEQNSAPRMSNVTANVSGGIFNYGVFNHMSSPAMTNVAVTASGEYSYGVYNEQASSPTMSGVTANCSGGISSYGIFSYSDSSPTMIHVNVDASGVNSYGVVSFAGGTVKINHSVIRGQTRTVFNDGVTTRVGNTQLDGGPSYTTDTGTFICAGVYDGGYVFYGSACP